MNFSAAVSAGIKDEPLMVKILDYRGFTLLEVMIAVAIMAIALTALLGSQSQSVSFASSARFEINSALLAQGKMSEMIMLDPEDLRSDSGDFGDDYPGYAWEATVSDVSMEGIDDLSAYLKQIDLTVTWSGYSYTIRLFHYIHAGN